MANGLNLSTHVQSILKHINNTLFDLRSIDRGHLCGDSVLGHGLSIHRLRIFLCSVSEKLKAWRSYWLKPKGDENIVFIELWGRTATSQIQQNLRGIFDLSVKIDGTVSRLCQHTHTNAKASHTSALRAGWRRVQSSANSRSQSLEARCECHDLKQLVESLAVSTEYVSSLAEIAFVFQSESIRGFSSLQAGLESCIPIISSQRRHIKLLTQFCASDSAHLDVDLVPDFKLATFTSRNLQSGKPLLRACYYVEDQSMKSIDYDIYTISAPTVSRLAESNLRVAAVDIQPPVGKSALSSATSFLIPSSATASESVDIIVVEVCNSQGQKLSVVENEKVFRTEMPLLEDGGSICMREKLSVAHGIANHGLLLLGSVWGDCFEAMNLRRRLDAQAQSRWFLHVHDVTAGLPPFEKSLCSSLKSQILDIGLLLIGVALSLQVCLEGEDTMFFASRILPAVERSMGTRYKLACMFCLGVQKIEMHSEHGIDSDVVTGDGHNVLQLFHAHVCQRLEQQLRALDLQV